MGTLAHNGPSEHRIVDWCTSYSANNKDFALFTCQTRLPVSELALRKSQKQRWHAATYRYTLEWRREAVPETITWQDVARGGANGRIEARRSSNEPGRFASQPAAKRVACFYFVA